MRTLAALLLAAVGVAPLAGAQTLQWERVGDRAFNASRPSVAPDGAMWAEGYDGMLRLRPPYGPDAHWEVVSDRAYNEVLALGQDTLITRNNLGPLRSVDNGATFVPMAATGWAGVRTFAEVPLGLPNGGALVGGTLNNYFAMYSHDRGATWARTAIPNNDRENPAADDFAVVRRGERAGRIVGAGKWGLATSDDGGASFAPVPGWWGHYRYQAMAVTVLDGAAPGGGDRLVATTIDTQQPDAECLVLVSDDGGDTWRRTADLRGDPNAYGPAVVNVGGGRVVVVMDGGHVWESADAGETWAIVGVVPGALMDPAGSPTNGRVTWAMRGPDGRLYVGGSRLGGATPGWAFRTKTPFVTGETGPAGRSDMSLSVRPNPSGGRVEVVLSLAEAGPVRVVVLDALGREVAVVLDGVAAAGERVVGVETASWPAGVYVVRATAGAEVATARLVVVR